MEQPLFFDLRATHNPHRWYLPLSPAICVGPPDKPFMWGGVGLAAAMAAMERTCGRPVIWATAQYLSYARPPTVVDLDVRVLAQGKHNTQARVVGHVDDREIFMVSAALGSRPSEVSGQWLPMPAAPPPEDCPRADNWSPEIPGMYGRLDIRLVEGFREPGRAHDGRSLLWMRPSQGCAIDAAMLAIFADFVPTGIGYTLGHKRGGNSLDNTIRIRRVVPTDWVLCDIRTHAVEGGVGHGAMYLFAQDGELMAIASQSAILRL